MLVSAPLAALATMPAAAVVSPLAVFPVTVPEAIHVAVSVGIAIVIAVTVAVGALVGLSSWAQPAPMLRIVCAAAPADVPGAILVSTPVAIPLTAPGLHQLAAVLGPVAGAVAAPAARSVSAIASVAVSVHVCLAARPVVGSSGTPAKVFEREIVAWQEVMPVASPALVMFVEPVVICAPVVEAPLVASVATWVAASGAAVRNATTVAIVPLDGVAIPPPAIEIVAVAAAAPQSAAKENH